MERPRSRAPSSGGSTSSAARRRRKRRKAREASGSAGAREGSKQNHRDKESKAKTRCKSKEKRGRSKEREAKDKEKGKKERERSKSRAKEKEKDKRKKKEKKSKQKKKEKEKDRAKDKDRSRRRYTSSTSRSPSKSCSSRSSEGPSRQWPIVVALGPRSFRVVQPVCELQDVGQATELDSLCASEGWTELATTAFAGLPHPALCAGGTPVNACAIASSATPQATLAQQYHLARAGFGSIPGTSLSQQQQLGKQQVCFNFTGGKCFRENCRFLHLGPGGRPPPPPPTFSGLLH